MLAPSHTRSPPSASRLSGGVVITTYAAATPAVARTAFATVRAVGPFIQLRDPPEPDDPPDDPRLPLVPLPRVDSDELLRKLSVPAPNDGEDPLLYEEPVPALLVEGDPELPLVDSRT